MNLYKLLDDTINDDIIKKILSYLNLSNDFIIFVIFDKYKDINLRENISICSRIQLFNEKKSFSKQYAKYLSNIISRDTKIIKVIYQVIF